MDGQLTLVYVDTLTEGGVCATGHPWKIHGRPINFGVRGYFDGGGGGVYVQPVIRGGSMDGQVTFVYVDTLTEGGVCATGPYWRIHGWPSNFGVRGYFDRGGGVCATGHPWRIHGWPSNFGVRGYFDRGGCMCNRSSLEDPWMAK